MTGAEYEAGIARLGLNQEAAGIFFGTTGRTSRRWIAGTAPIPEAVAMLLRVMVARGLTVDDVLTYRDWPITDAVGVAMSTLSDEAKERLLGDGK